jgi:ligand-binding SRPBCC domain-containing protein
MTITRLAIYNSADPYSLLAAAVCRDKYPSCSLSDTTGLSAVQVTSLISALASTYTDIFTCARCDYVAETLPTATQTVTVQGTDGDQVSVLVGGIPIGHYVKVTADNDTTKLAVKIAANINAGSTIHGFTTYPVVPTTAAFVIKAPVGSGDTYNAAAVTCVITGSTMAITPGNFTSTGVDLVGAQATGNLSLANYTTLSTKCTTNHKFYNTSLTTNAPYNAWDHFHSGVTPPRIIYLLGQPVISAAIARDQFNYAYSAAAMAAAFALVPVTADNPFFGRLLDINSGKETPSRKQDLELLEYFTGGAIYDRYIS